MIIGHAPRRLLKKIADGYELDARREDKRSELDEEPNGLDCGESKRGQMIRHFLAFLESHVRDVGFKGTIQREVINLNEEQIKIIKLLGHDCEKYYI